MTNVTVVKYFVERCSNASSNLDIIYHVQETIIIAYFLSFMPISANQVSSMLAMKGEFRWSKNGQSCFIVSVEIFLFVLR